MGRGQAKDHGEKRQALLKAAAAFFAANGYERASMNDLARACGVSKALVYHYFDGKEALLFAILKNHLERLAADVEQAAQTASSPDARLGQLIARIVALYEGADAQHRLQLETMASLTGAQQAELARLQKRIVEVMSAAIRDTAPDVFRADPALLRPTTMSVFGILNWMYIWFRPGGEISRSEYAALVTRMVLKGVSGAGSRDKNGPVPSFGSRSSKQ